MYVYHVIIVSEKGADLHCKSSSVHMHNFDSIYAADKIILTKKCQLFACMDKMYVHMFLICALILMHIT